MRMPCDPQALAQRFAQPPIWTPELKGEPRFSDRVPVHASVLVPLVLREEGLTVLLTERTTHLSSHSGQIAFPGGKADPDDSSETDTALREAEEEIGLNRHDVEVLGHLPLYTTGSAFIVTPVVALVQPDYTMTLNPPRGG
jgi:8-oxo-dGTP pyrophosphatase MutT (NUDIX family)